MAVLPIELRNKLERTIIEARDMAEAGAQAALKALAVHHHGPYGHMTPEQRKLRNHLRARARQLGDKQNQKGELEITHLVWECAYEYWHRMLFARFLAENDLLIEREMSVAISLEECKGLAKEGGKDLWTFASDLAQRMLPQIFRIDDPILKVAFAHEHRLRLERLLDNLEPSIFIADDSLGWVYQFWQSKQKEEVIESGIKVGANELPSVTQIFTENYMVDFILDNTIGAWWASKISDAGFDVLTEEEARKAAALHGCPWKYLRFFKNQNDKWQPAAGSYDQWPKRAADLRCMDPCCGSGHFLVGFFERLVPIRMVEERLTESSSAKAVIQDNLHGLEIDPRCTKLAAFALSLAVWKRNPDSVTEPLPSLNIACSGLEIGATKQQWLSLSSKNSFEMDQLYELFKNAATLGSLICPEKHASLELSRSNFHNLESDIIKGLEKFKDTHDFESGELGVQAKGLADAYRLMGSRYHLIATNVPYLARGKQCNILREFIDRYYPLGKHDLGIVFLLRCLDFCGMGGTTAIVTPQNWLFLWSYKKLRNILLRDEEWVFVVRLGTKGFQTPMWDFNVMLSAFSHKQPSNRSFMGIDVASHGTPESKSQALISDDSVFINQKEQLSNPDQRVIFEKIDTGELLSDYAGSYWGIGTGDIPRFCKKFWEINNMNNRWRFLHTTSVSRDPYSGLEDVIDWKIATLDDCPTNADKKLWRANRWTRGSEGWGNKGIAISQMAGLSASLYLGDIFQNGVATIIPKEPDNLPAIWTFCSSPEFHESVRKIDQKLCVTNMTLIQVPFDFEHWNNIASKLYPDGLPLPFSKEPIQWIFHGHPCGTVMWDEETKWIAHGKLRSDNKVLQVTVVRLLGYRWPAELDHKMELAAEQREWLKKCDDLLKYTDDDGIVCIPSIRGEEPADNRLRELLVAAFGQDWSSSSEQELIKVTGINDANLDKWLRDHFFEQHCKLFHHRPFIWHIWDGRSRDGFHALVNYHKLAEGNGRGRQLLENLTYSYLGDWITRQREGVKRGEGGAEDRLAAALELQKRLIAIIDGEPPFDIFVRWKPIEDQPIGWEPDINDGVRLNIRPFMAQDIPGGRKGAGILHWKPNIKWGKDRGKEPIRPKEQYPWFWEKDKFTGDRVNDIHLTNEEKWQARKN